MMAKVYECGRCGDKSSVNMFGNLTQSVMARAHPIDEDGVMYCVNSYRGLIRWTLTNRDVRSHHITNSIKEDS